MGEDGSGALIDAVRAVCDVLSEAPLTAREAALRLGEGVVDEGADRPVIVESPRGPLRSIRIVRDADTDEPKHADLAFDAAAAAPLGALAAALGAYREVPRVHAGDRRRVMFGADIAGRPYTCAVIATVEPGPRGLEDGTVTAVTVRRDRRLSRSAS